MHEAQSHVFEIIMIVIVGSHVTFVRKAHQCGQLFSSATGRQRGVAYRAMKRPAPSPPSLAPPPSTQKRFHASP